MSVYDQLARRLIRLTAEQIHEHSPPVERHKVTGVNPLTMESMHGDLALSEEDPDVEVEQGVSQYHAQYGIEEGDVVHVRRTGYGTSADYSVIGVVADREAKKMQEAP